MVDRNGVGGRVAEQRKLRGLTQAQLAQRAHVSLSLVRKVEQGSAPASPAFVSATAHALGVGVAELLGQPRRPDSPAEHRVFAVIPALRRELAAYRLPPDDGGTIRSLPELRAAVDHASGLRHAVDLTSLGAELPGLLAELRAAVHTLTGIDREFVFGLLAETYYAAGQLASKLGYIDLASLGGSLRCEAGPAGGCLRPEDDPACDASATASRTRCAAAVDCSRLSWTWGMAWVGRSALALNLPCLGVGSERSNNEA